MKLKVTLIFVILIFAFAGTAYADDFDPATGAVIIDTPWAIGGLDAAIMAEVNADGAAATDVLSISIDAAASANSTDMEDLDDYGNLQSLAIASSVTITETVDNFFYNHANIQSVIIYPAVNLDDNCFRGCAALTTVELHGAGVFDNNNIRNNAVLTNLTINNISDMDNNNLRNNASLTSL